MPVKVSPINLEHHKLQGNWLDSFAVAEVAIEEAFSQGGSKPFMDDSHRRSASKSVRRWASEFVENSEKNKEIHNEVETEGKRWLI